MTANEVLAHLTEHARGTLDDFLDERGRVDFSKAKEAGKMHLLKEYSFAEERRAGEVIASIESHGGTTLERVALFDVYRGAPLEPSEKSLAIRLWFRLPDRTLTDAEIDASLDAIRSGLAADVGGRIRT